jgi:NAD(P)-dependent dehydrogenase (short-subunit alcohol dehydrogenase family)
VTNGPVALITGGARGIGLGIARSLAEAGFDLALNGVRPANQVQDTLNSFSPDRKVAYVQGDVGSSADRKVVVSQVREQFGRLDVLVNNAGITSPGRRDLLEADEDGFDRVMDVNLKGPYFLTKACANWMIAQRSEFPDRKPCIINISSISAEFVSVNRGDYCMSKAALRMATKLWATRLGEFGIGVYEVQPGVIKSDMTADVTEKYDRLISEGLTLEPRWGLPEDVGLAVATLATGRISYATGQVLYVDGGMRVPRL